MGTYYDNRPDQKEESKTDFCGFLQNRWSGIGFWGLALPVDRGKKLSIYYNNIEPDDDLCDEDQLKSIKVINLSENAYKPPKALALTVESADLERNHDEYV